MLMIAVLPCQDGFRMFRLFSYENHVITHELEDKLIQKMKDGLLIENLGLNEDDKLIGTQGSIDRYAHLPIDNYIINTIKCPVVIINRVPNGYTVVDCNGNTEVMREEELLAYAKQYGVANAKVVRKGNTEFISAINGSFTTIGMRLSDNLMDQWKRLQALRQEGKLSEKSVKKLDAMEKEFFDKIKKLKKAELRNRLNGVMDIARAYDLILNLAEILDEVDIERVEEAQKRASKKYKEVKSIIKSHKNLSKERHDKLNSAIKLIGKELKKTIRYVEEEEMSSDECIRRFEVIGKHLEKLKGSLDR